MKMDFFERIMIPEGLRIPYFGGLLYRTLSEKARRDVRKIAIESLSLNKEPRDYKLVFTLTSFPDRIDTVQYTLRTLFSQSMKPDRVILWLSEEEFENREMPESIKAFQKIGLEIRFCENLYGHKRNYILVDEQKDDELVVMFDDDILFPHYLVERLYDKWLDNKDCVICERGQVMTFEGDKVKNPGRWSSTSNEGIDSPSYKILPSPGGGCLVPPKALYKDSNNAELIKRVALKTDDIWLMFMITENDTKVLRTHKNHRIFMVYDNNQSVQLGKEAIYEGRYERDFRELSELYPHAYENMTSKA